MLPNVYNQIPGSDQAGTVIDSTIFDRIRKLFSGKAFTLGELPGFHFTMWSQQKTYYEELINWYEGKPLKEKLIDPISKKEIDKYPLHLNPLKDTCEKHTQVLLGTALDGIRFGGVPIQFIVDDKAVQADANAVAKPAKPAAPPKPGESPMQSAPVEKTPEQKAADEKKARIEDVLVKVFKDSGGGSTFITQGIRSQYLGGTVWQVKFQPWNKGHEVTIDTPPVTEFLGFPEGPNMDKLREAWIIRQISPMEALNYGYPSNSIAETQYYYIEYWTKETYSVRINDWVIEKPGEDGAEAIRFEGPNPWGVVPIVYIPHIRTTSFLGNSIITETVKGVIKEMNLREADLGDAVNEDAHNYVAVRNVRQGIKTIKLPDGRLVLDLGSVTGMGVGEHDPDMISVSSKSVSDSMFKYTMELDNIYRREVKHPAVADGVDQGSQRSSLTLTTRMWPLVAHVESERMHMVTGMLEIIKVILTIMSVKGLNGIVEEDIETSITVKWSQMLPRDREALVNEIVARKGTDLGSLEHLLELLGDVYDIPGEIAKIDERKKSEQQNALAQETAKMETAAKLAPKTGLNQDPGGPKGEDAPAKKSQPAE